MRRSGLYNFRHDPGQDKADREQALANGGLLIRHIQTDDELVDRLARFSDDARERFWRAARAALKAVGSDTLRMGVFVSGKNEKLVRVLLLNLGQDRYSFWPYGTEGTATELLAAVQIVRMSDPEENWQARLCFICGEDFVPGDMVLDVTRSEDPVGDNAHGLCLVDSLVLRDRLTGLLPPVRIFGESDSGKAPADFDALARCLFDIIKLWKLAHGARDWRLRRRRASSGWSSLLAHHRAIGSQSPVVHQEEKK